MKKQPRKARFMAILLNVDSSIMNLKLKHGLKIESMSERVARNLIASLDNTTVWTAAGKLLSAFDMTEHKMYVISKRYDLKNPKGHPLESQPQYSPRLIQDYIDNLLKLMRLFKEGGIYSTTAYNYRFEKRTPTLIWAKWGGKTIPRSEFTLTNSETPKLQKYLDKTAIPFGESFLNLALDSYDESYFTHNKDLSFLNLMIALELLFNPGGDEAIYKISRNTAVLLGKDINSSKEIFGEIKKLYTKRSKLIHGDEQKKSKHIITHKDITKIRGYVRESIKKINDLQMDKSELTKLLHLSGFGESL